MRRHFFRVYLLLSIAAVLLTLGVSTWSHVRHRKEVDRSLQEALSGPIDEVRSTLTDSIRGLAAPTDGDAHSHPDDALAPHLRGRGPGAPPSRRRGPRRDQEGRWQGPPPRFGAEGASATPPPERLPALDENDLGPSIFDPTSGQRTFGGPWRALRASPEFQRNVPPHLRRTLRQLEREVGRRFGMPASIVHPEVLPISDELMERVLHNEIVIHRAGRHRVTLTALTPELVLILGPVPQPPMLRIFLDTAIPLLALVILLGVGTFLLLRPLERRLTHIAETADLLGEGQLDARAEEGNDALSSLAEHMNSMAEHIQNYVSDQRALLGALSHELRTPMARVYLLLDDARDSNEDRRNRALDRMDVSVEEMNQLIEEMLAWARLDIGALKYETIHLREFAEDIVRRIPPRSSDITPELTYEIDNARLDARSLGLILRNLVGNAYRYANSTIQVSFKPQGEFLILTVEDDGPGVPAEAQTKIFDPFFTMDPARSNTRGTVGLGLALVARSARAHGGKAICTRSEKLGGAAFIISFKRQLTEPSASKPVSLRSGRWVVGPLEPN